MSYTPQQRSDPEHLLVNWRYFRYEDRITIMYDRAKATLLQNAAINSFEHVLGKRQNKTLTPSTSAGYSEESSYQDTALQYVP